MRVQPSNCPFSVILFQIHERWASLDAEAIPLLLNGVALGVYRADMVADRLRRGKRTNGSVTKYPGQQCNSQQKTANRRCSRRQRYEKICPAVMADVDIKLRAQHKIARLGVLPMAHDRIGSGATLEFVCETFAKWDDAALFSRVGAYEKQLTRQLTGDLAVKVKPQVKKGGIVMPPATLTQLIREIIEWCDNAEVASAAVDEEQKSLGVNDFIHLMLSINGDQERQGMPDCFETWPPTDADLEKYYAAMTVDDDLVLREMKRQWFQTSLGCRLTRSWCLISSLVTPTKRGSRRGRQCLPTT